MTERPTAAAPHPELRLLSRVSPSLGEMLRTCSLQVAFRLDAAFDNLRRPSPASLMGLVAHDMYERMAQGRYDDVEESTITPALEAEWDAAIEARCHELQASRLAPVPDPERWPGYQVTRIRLLRVLRTQLLHRRDTTRNTQDHVGTEEWLQSSDGLIGGRADRIEVASAGATVVDLKSGWTLPDEIKPSHRRQLLAYAYLWHEQTGNWPLAGAIQRLDGSRLQVPIDPKEATQVAADLRRAVVDYNGQVGEGNVTASPSPEGCRRCNYRAACQAFFAHQQPEWAPFERNLLGVIDVENTSEDTSTSAVTIIPTGSPPQLSRNGPVRLLGLRSSMPLSSGMTLAVIEGASTRAESDTRVTWQTQVASWNPFIVLEASL